ncbi:tldc domain-containing protein [Stylonychia lemnae]|uniref:Tldc domain-containing protein n=1 Tax=Stylonychia lemnae TaxID=5949 RepID=A0A077ZWF9_STYLE|nr:tldc domain-containing protein [Stylonychia lemnae]|eukprot:CDW74280.1 tldc domain-containing protein [Stylonychia lemnae]
MEQVEGDICPKCNQIFNQIDLLKLILPCGDSMCLDCLYKQLQDVQNKVYCPVDNEELEVSQRYREKIINLKLSKQKEIVQLKCSKHPLIPANYYCNKERVMGCHVCVHDSHLKHIKLVEPFVNDDIYQFNNRCLIRLQEQKSKCQEAINQVLELKLKKKNISSATFVKTYLEVVELLEPHIRKDEQYELGIVYKTPNLFDFDDETMDAFDIKNQDEDIIKDWIGNAATIKFKLLYRAHRDGFSSQDFHRVCDGKGPLLFLIKSKKHNQVFGSYTSEKMSGGYSYKRDDKAFVFSLTNRTKHPLYQNFDNSLYFNASEHIHFGEDLIIRDNPNNNVQSTSNIGYAYQPPRDIFHDSDKAKEYLAGAQNFRVQEMEAFEVIKVEQEQQQENQ